jgi:hypothetical protein
MSAPACRLRLTSLWLVLIPLLLADGYPAAARADPKDPFILAASVC